MFVAFVILLVAFAIFIWSKRFIYKLSWQISGPIGFPIVGNFDLFMKPPGRINTFFREGEREKETKTFII